MGGSRVNELITRSITREAGPALLRPDLTKSLTEIPCRRRADRRLFGSEITLTAVVAHFSVYMSHYCFSFLRKGCP